MFDTLQPQNPDALLQLIGLFKADPRADKLDLGVGVYRDNEGRTIVLSSIKEAERRLLATQDTKAYLGVEGDARFAELAGEIALGRAVMASDRVVGIQTPGGSGALRISAELLAAAKPGARIWVGTPTWPNHEPILKAARLEIATYRYFDRETQTVLFDSMMEALSGAAAGDVVLLHGCCHNPTGADLTLDQWKAVTALVAGRGLFPLIDLAYQGLGHGMEEDAVGVRLLLDAVDEALVAYSCDKNFALYRDRTGALYVKVGPAGKADVVRGNVLALARVNWSMPPDHGAAAVRIVLDDPELRKVWEAESAAMGVRLREVRAAMAKASPMLAAAPSQNGMFALLPLTPAQVAALRAKHGVYMAGNGRINIAGLAVATVPRFAQALADVA